MTMTINKFIEELQRLQPKLREKEIVITASNGLQFPPVVKQQLIDEYNPFGGVENVKNMVLTFD